MKEFKPFEYHADAERWLNKNCAKCSKAEKGQWLSSSGCDLLGEIEDAVFELGTVKLETAQKIGYRKKTGGWQLNAMCRRFYPS